MSVWKTKPSCKRSANNKLIKSGTPKDIAAEYLAMSSGNQQDHYIQFRGKSYGHADGVRKIQDMIAPESQ
jgi:hypothetical protein